MKIPKIRQLPSGAWFCQLRLDGQSISITDDDPDVVTAKAYAYKAGVLKARKKPENITLKEACNRYIDSKRNRLSPSTIQGYEKIKNNMFPSLMRMRLEDITTKKIDAAIEVECGRISPKTGKKYSTKSIRNSYMFIVSVLGKYAPDVNTKNVSLPEKKQKPVVIIEPKEIYKIIKDTSIELPCLLAMWLSLSMSEIRGLTKSKSIHGNSLSVIETVIDVDGKPLRKEGGKEEKRSRTLGIPPYLKGLIDAVDGDVIVPQTAAAITNKFYRLLKKNNLPHINFHKLRHISASVMAMLGIPEKEALERGGWKTDNIYKQVYTHTFTASRIAADKKIDEYFENIIANENANENI